MPLLGADKSAHICLLKHQNFCISLHVALALNSKYITVLCVLCFRMQTAVAGIFFIVLHFLAE